MSKRCKYDHVINEKFDDYENRRKCTTCRVLPLYTSSPSWLSKIKCRRTLLFVLVAVLAIGVIFYGLYYSRINDSVDTDSETPEKLENASSSSIISRMYRIFWKCRPGYFRRKQSDRKNHER